MHMHVCDGSSWIVHITRIGTHCLSQVVGDRLLSGSDDAAVRVWVLRGPPTSWRCDDVLAGHRGAVWTVAAAADGRPISGSADRTVRVWPSPTGATGQPGQSEGRVAARTPATVLRGHQGAVYAVAAAGPGRRGLRRQPS